MGIGKLVAHQSPEVFWRPGSGIQPRRRCRGRRRGKVATCRARLKGWVENVAARSPIWGDVDLEAFCRKTGYSREHATRELSKLRREGGLAFETKLRSKNGKGRKVWGVILAVSRCFLESRRTGNRELPPASKSQHDHLDRFRLPCLMRLRTEAVTRKSSLCVDFVFR